MSASTAIALATGAATIWLPEVAVAALGLNAAATLAAHLAQLSAGGPAAGSAAAPLGPATARPLEPVPPPGEVPFVSVHVPIHAEPPGLVAATLLALARVEHPRFEVIVLDNNTTDPALWRPVARLCRRLGPPFRFVHAEGVEGAKAGALTLSRALADPATALIAVVDADYQVAPDFLATAVPHFADPGVAFVQFPQAYRGVTPECAGLVQDLADYFHSHGARANATGSMLLTGTLSVIRARALDAVGGWSGATVTEDAELGVRLWAAGFAGVYVERIVGRGLLPLSLEGLAAQRHRWVAGNVQTLVRAAGDLAQGRPGRRSIIGQLTTWPMFWLLPTGALLGGALAGGAGSAAVTLAGATLLGTFGVMLARQVWRGGVGPGVQAVWVRLALARCSSGAVVDGVSRRRLAFARTDKFGAGPRRGKFGAGPRRGKFGAGPRLGTFGPGPRRGTFGAGPRLGTFGAGPRRGWGGAALALAGAVAALVFVAAAQPVAAAACAMIAVGWLAARDIDARLRRYAVRVADGPSLADRAAP